MGPTRLSSLLTVSVNGTPNRSLIEASERVEVEGHAGLPAMLLLDLNDPARDVLDGLKVGQPITIDIEGTGSTQDTVFDGEITGLEAEFGSGGGHAAVRAFDRAHRLHRGRHSETYLKQTDSQIAQTLAGRAGLSAARVERTTTRYEWLAQTNQTDWEFLKSRAAAIGFEVSVDGRDLVFGKPQRSASAPPPGRLDEPAVPRRLVLGKELLEFRARVTSSGQVSEVQVRGWDPAKKTSVLGKHRAQQSASAAVQDDPGGLARRFPAAVHAVADLGAAVATEAQTGAQATAEAIASAFSEAEGIAEGDAGLRAGIAVSVGNVGKAFDGRYTLTSVRHVFGRDGYRTHFTVSGHHDRTLLGLVSNGAGADRAGRLYGVVPAVVSNIKDPDKLGRVKLKLPWLSERFETDWARVVHPGAGRERGWVALPEVNDEVLVAFQDGDVRRPYVLGGLFNAMDKPPRAAELVDGGKGAVKKRVLVSRKGHAVVLSDEDGKEAVEITSADTKLSIVLDQKKTEITVTSNGAVTISADKDVRVDAKGNASVTAEKSASVTARKDVSVHSDTKVVLDATDVEVKAKKGIQIQANGPVQIKGNPIQLN